jgi:hypothetical protein
MFIVIMLYVFACVMSIAICAGALLLVNFLEKKILHFVRARRNRGVYVVSRLELPSTRYPRR